MVKEALHIDKENGDNKWWDTIFQEMGNDRLAFQVHDEHKSDLPIGYQQIKCHIIFDLKMGGKIRQKARLVGGGHMT